MDIRAASWRSRNKLDEAKYPSRTSGEGNEGRVSEADRPDHRASYAQLGPISYRRLRATKYLWLWDTHYSLVACHISLHTAGMSPQNDLGSTERNFSYCKSYRRVVIPCSG